MHICLHAFCHVLRSDENIKECAIQHTLKSSFVVDFPLISLCFLQGWLSSWCKTNRFIITINFKFKMYRLQNCIIRNVILCWSRLKRNSNPSKVLSTILPGPTFLVICHEFIAYKYVSKMCQVSVTASVDLPVPKTNFNEVNWTWKRYVPPKLW